jgi:phosphodiesterase/alkaline phosphatase D-like protein
VSLLLLGPVLRHVGQTTASVWVQTGQAARVDVVTEGTGVGTARTFEVAGHHFALVAVTGLPPDSTVAYRVLVDGAPVWPAAASPFPPSVIRTRGPASATRHRIIFGSCRYPKVADPRAAARLGLDALDSYAVRMTRRPVDEWPDALLLLGDQVYADELTPRLRRRITVSHDRPADWPDDEIVGFDEYAGLYLDSWSDPEVRWLMSTVSTAMIFDDHDVRDDWNTSAAWRADMARLPWWRDRIRAAIASYWVFQHLGNLPPDDLATDPYHRMVNEADGDVWPMLAELADRADAEVDGAKAIRFSFRWDLGDSRFIMIDSRNGRILEDGRHLMLSEAEFRWVEEQALAEGPVEHLVLGTSVPWLMPHALGDVETVNEIAAARPGRRGRLAETVRQAADLEHWAAFRDSFDRLARLVGTVAARGPATVNVLSGDVHHSYAARVDLPQPTDTAVHQLTCSPVHNHIDWIVRPGFRLGWSRGARWLARRWAAHVGAPAPPVGWERVVGPLFGNMIATLELDGRHAEVAFEQPRSAASLAELARVRLTS